jgi:hypothetical protein
MATFTSYYIFRPAAIKKSFHQITCGCRLYSGAALQNSGERPTDIRLAGGGF